MNSPILPIKFKAPGASKLYRMNFTSYLNAKDTLASATIVAPDDVTVVSTDFTDTRVTTKLSGGVLGQKYTITIHFTTAGGIVDERSFVLVIAQT